MKGTVEAIKVAVEERVTDATVMVNDVTKNNGVKYTGLVIRTGNSCISPTIYIDRFVDEIENGDAGVSEVAEKIIEIAKEHQGTEFEANLEIIRDKELFLQHVEYRVVNASMNEELLDKAPHKEFCDLAVLYIVVLAKESDSSATVTVTNDLIASLDITTEELEEAAQANRNPEDYTASSLTELIKSMNLMSISDEDIEAMSGSEIPMFVITNKHKNYGAAAILDAEVMANASKIMGGDFFILPSSVHELIIIPSDGHGSPSELRGMVQSVNTTLAPNEVLSNEVYLYDSVQNKVVIA